jgi:large subunit ribosomal protein L17
MNHRRRGRKLNRNASHRLALFRNLSRALIMHETIRTTLPKAKELRPFVEKLITFAKNAAVLNDQISATTDEATIKALKAKVLHLRRQAAAKLGPMAGTGLYDKQNDQVDEPTVNTVLKKLFTTIGPRYKTRPGGYTRVMKLHERRLGDAGSIAVIQLMKEGEQKVRMKEKTAPTPTPAA